MIRKLSVTTWSNIVKQLKFEKNKGKIVEFDETLITEESNIIQLSPGALGAKGGGWPSSIPLFTILIFHTMFRASISRPREPL
jgi:hypothetical protein